ncbi:hypothetical protein FRB99_005525 [Tulasnella sp. 403]|nr:hypothetical protein FRB99_005525 [Tulasnella sp. 403]
MSNSNLKITTLEDPTSDVAKTISKTFTERWKESDPAAKPTVHAIYPISLPEQEKRFWKAM